MNREKVDPAPVQTGAMKYPSDLEEWVAKNVKNAIFVDTEAILKEVGTRKALNIVMLGILSRDLEFNEAQWESGHQVPGEGKVPRDEPEGLQDGQGLQVTGGANAPPDGGGRMLSCRRGFVS